MMDSPVFLPGLAPADGTVTGRSLRFAPGVLAVGAGALWLSDATVPVIARIDTGSNRVVGLIEIGADPEAPAIVDVATSEEGVWVLGGDGGVTEIHPETNDTSVAAVAGDRSGAAEFGSAIAVGDGDVWVAGGKPGALRRCAQSPSDGPAAPLALPLAGPLQSIAFGQGAVWVADAQDGTVLRVDPVNGKLAASVGIGGPVEGLRTGAGAVWASVHGRPSDDPGDCDGGSSGGGSRGERIVRIDPAANKVTGSIDVTEAPDAFDAGPQAVWAAARTGDGGARTTVTRIDPANLGVVDDLTVDGQVVCLAEGQGALWGGVWDPERQAAHVVRIDTETDEVVARIDLPDIRFAPGPLPSGQDPHGSEADDSGRPAGGSRWPRPDADEPPDSDELPDAHLPPPSTAQERVRPQVRSHPAYDEIAEHYDGATAGFAWARRAAVERLDLQPGEVVVDVGCGTGLCFEYLRAAVGPGGRVIGVDQSSEMLRVARRRVETSGWDNVVLIESAIHHADIGVMADAALFCVVHDVLRHPGSVERVVGQVRPGGRVVAAGGKFAAWWLPLVNSAVVALHSPFVSSFEGFDQPWSHLARFVDLHVEPWAFDAAYVAHGTTTVTRNDRGGS